MDMIMMIIIMYGQIITIHLDSWWLSFAPHDTCCHGTKWSAHAIKSSHWLNEFGYTINVGEKHIYAANLEKKKAQYLRYVSFLGSSTLLGNSCDIFLVGAPWSSRSLLGVFFFPSQKDISRTRSHFLQVEHQVQVGSKKKNIDLQASRTVHASKIRLTNWFVSEIADVRGTNAFVRPPCTCQSVCYPVGEEMGGCFGGQVLRRKNILRVGGVESRINPTDPWNRPQVPKNTNLKRFPS